MGAVARESSNKVQWSTPAVSQYESYMRTFPFLKIPCVSACVRPRSPSLSVKDITTSTESGSVGSPYRRKWLYAITGSEGYSGFLMQDGIKIPPRSAKINRYGVLSFKRKTLNKYTEFLNHYFACTKIIRIFTVCTNP